MPFLLFVVSALFALMLASGVYVFVVGCVRRKELPWLVEEEIMKTPYGKFCSCITAADRWLKENHAADITTISKDGLKLHAYWIPAENARGTVLLAHGYRSSMLLDFGAAFEVYHDLGMNILVPDQRAHGKSQGRFITFGVKESQDMLCWICYHNSNFGELPLILSGMSMGASTVLYLADEELPANVKGIIADCGFTSPRDILASVFKDVTHLPAGPSLVVADLCARLFAGFGLNQKDTRRSLANSKLPILLIHGVEDGFVPCAMSEQAYAACTGPKQLLLVEGADHGVSFLQAPDRYGKSVMDFIENHMI